MAGTLCLSPPPLDIASRALELVPLDPASLCRISRRATGEPYFGRSGACRFDDPARRFGSCYLGLTLSVSFAESVLHDAEPDAAGFKVPATEISSRFALRFAGKPLRLAKLYGAALLRLGGNGEISGTPDYTLSQAWAGALVAHPAGIDGFFYMSRRVNDSLAVVLFEREDGKKPDLRLDQAVPLHHHADYLATLRDLGVSVG